MAGNNKSNAIPAKYYGIAIGLALVLTTLGVFYQVRSFRFVTYDDPDYVYRNANVQAGITAQSIKWAFTTSYAANWHPLTWLSHMLDWRVFGSNPAGHHVINLILHIANTLLLFIVLQQMTNALWQSAFVAALFALHPLHVESVAWVAERKDVLSTLFWMLTMWAYLGYVKHPNVRRYLLVLVSFALGLMAKPMLVTLPFVLLLLDYWPLERFRQRTVFHLIGEKVPFFILSAASSAVTFIVQRSASVVIPFGTFPLKYRVFNAVISYVEYACKMFCPSRLAVFYPHPAQNVSIPYFIMSAVLLLAVTILVIRFAANRRYLVTGWFWYLGTLVPAAGFVQVGLQAMADRYTYVPLTGLFIMVAWGVPDLLAKLQYRKIILVSVATLTVPAMSMCTFFQLRHWKDTSTLLQHAIDVTTNNVVAINNLAWFLATSPETSGQNPERAIHLARRACELNRYRSPGSLDTLAAAYAAAGAFDEAVDTAQKALQLCRSPGQEALKEEIRNHLGLFREGKPYVEFE